MAHAEAQPTTDHQASSASSRLEASLSLQRKAAIASGRATDYAGRVQIVPMEHFDMSRTIFGGVQGALPRMVMKAKLANEVYWHTSAIEEIEAAYAASEKETPAPPVDSRLIDFMVEECDFSMEHADGSFLQHLVFCHDYSAKHFPEHSPNVALLHSILGTATNTFAMDASKLPKLKELLTAFEAIQVEAFPSLLRLFYDGALLPELTRNLDRLDALKSLKFHRVIDNEEMEIDAENFWIALNYHLMHFVDFMPAANWGAHLSDPLLLQFRELSEFLDRAGQRRAKVEIEFPDEPQKSVGEVQTFGSRVSKLIPVGLKKKLARKGIREYSEKIGHSLDYTITWG
ncbi:MAG: hypothetical protein AAF654_00810 [Myxococcota bacterium]